MRIPDMLSEFAAEKYDFDGVVRVGFED